MADNSLASDDRFLEAKKKREKNIIINYNASGAVEREKIFKAENIFLSCNRSSRLPSQ